MYCVPYVCVYTNAMCAMCMCTNAMVHVWGSEGGFQELVLSSHHVGLWGIKLKWLKLSGGAFTGRAISLAHNLFSRLLIYIAKGAKKKKDHGSHINVPYHPLETELTQGLMKVTLLSANDPT